MDLRQLEYFVAVAEEANFTRAARRVHVTQSGISAQIRQFERELGAELFDRSARTVRLTAAGAAALPHARVALAAAAGVRRSIDDVTGLVRGRVRVGMVTGCTTAALFAALASFHRAHPRIEITLGEAGSAVLIARVRAGETDLALVGAAGGVPAGLSGWAVAGEGPVALVPGGHALTAWEEVPVRRLGAYPLICPPAGTGVRDGLDRACAAAGVRPNVALEATAPAAVAGLAAQGLGVAVLSASAAADHPELTALPIEDAGAPAALALVWHGESTVVRALLPHCDRAFGRTPAPRPVPAQREVSGTGQSSPPVQASRA